VKVVKAKVDPQNPDAPCVLVPGKPGKYAPGEAVLVKFTPANVVTGCMMDYVPLLGLWRCQVGTLPEGEDPVCICTVADGVGVLNPACYYHLSAPKCPECGPGTDMIEFTTQDDVKLFACSGCACRWREEQV
jgi:hypothetical protein